MTESYEWVPLMEVPCPAMNSHGGDECSPDRAHVLSVDVRYPGDRAAFTGWLPAAAAARFTLLAALAGADGRNTVFRAVRLFDGTRLVTFPMSALGQVFVSTSDAEGWMPATDPGERERYWRSVQSDAYRNAAASALLIKRG